MNRLKQAKLEACAKFSGRSLEELKILNKEYSDIRLGWLLYLAARNYYVLQNQYGNCRHKITRAAWNEFKILFGELNRRLVEKDEDALKGGSHRASK